MTYESLNERFRLRVLKKDEDYSAAQLFWQENVVPAIRHCPAASADGVSDYAGVLRLLMAQHEEEKLLEDDTHQEETDW